MSSFIIDLFEDIIKIKGKLSTSEYIDLLESTIHSLSKYIHLLGIKEPIEINQEIEVIEVIEVIEEITKPQDHKKIKKTKK